MLFIPFGAHEPGLPKEPVDLCRILCPESEFGTQTFIGPRIIAIMPRGITSPESAELGPKPTLTLLANSNIDFSVP